MDRPIKKGIEGRKEAEQYLGNSKWISVKDRLPESYGKYWVFRGGKCHTEVWNNTGWAYNNTSVTHWMPLPEPPKTEKE